MLSFANPNFLGSKNDFRKNFENAIIRGRDADATDDVKAKCEKKLKELGEMVSSSSFVGRTIFFLNTVRYYTDYCFRTL